MTKSKRGSRKSPVKTKKTSSAKVREASFVMGEGVWPLERDVLFRPDRLKYVRKLIKPQGCVFCAAAQGEMNFTNLRVFETSHSMVVLNKFPYNSGHVLILPRRHVADPGQMSEIEWRDLADLQRLTLQVVKDVYQPAGFNVGLNLGAVAGAGIPEHLHFHLIPRWAGDLNFFPLIAETKVVVETLETTYTRIAEGFRGIRG